MATISDRLLSHVLSGNVIRYNFWHHIGSGHDVAGQSGIRLDGGKKGTLKAPG